jgi:hypothetical protein
MKAMILNGSAVHLNDFGSSSGSLRKRLMAAWRWTIERSAPRFNRRFSRRSLRTALLSHEHEVGVKWKVSAHAGQANGAP